jgi:hypothetical protein
MTGSPPDLDGNGIDELRRLLIEALERIAALTAENAALREEIARLKGLKGRPKIPPSKPSGMERASVPPAPRDKGRRGRSKSARLVLAEDRIVTAEVPAGSRFKGFTIAPSGTSPVSRNRHSATISLRASATIAIRRTRRRPACGTTASSRSSADYEATATPAPPRDAGPTRCRPC